MPGGGSIWIIITIQALYPKDIAVIHIWGRDIPVKVSRYTTFWKITKIYPANEQIAPVAIAQYQQVLGFLRTQACIIRFVPGWLTTLPHTRGFHSLSLLILPFSLI